MLRKLLIAAWRRWWKRFSLWEQIRRGPSSMLCAICSSRDSKSPLLHRRCQENKEEEGTVRTKKRKAIPVSSWCYQRQAGSMKALQRVVWSLIFLAFGVDMAKAKAPEIQAQRRSEKGIRPIPQVDLRWKRMHSCEKFVNGNGMRLTIPESQSRANAARTTPTPDSRRNRDNGTTKNTNNHKQTHPGLSRSQIMRSANCAG